MTVSVICAPQNLGCCNFELARNTQTDLRDSEGVTAQQDRVYLTDSHGQESPNGTCKYLFAFNWLPKSLQTIFKKHLGLSMLPVQHTEDAS